MQGRLLNQKKKPVKEPLKSKQSEWVRETAISKALRAEYASGDDEPIPDRFKKLIDQIRQEELKSK